MINIASKDVEFAPGAVLTGNMLKEMYGFPYRMFHLQYADYGDGIISGMELRQEGDTVIIGSGIIKLNGRLYYSENDIDISKLGFEKSVSGGNFYLGLKKKESGNLPGIKYYTLSVEPYEREDKNSAEIILMRLNRDNADKRALPKMIKDNEDPFHEFFENSRCGLLETPFSCYGGSTFIPYVCQAVRNYLESKQRCDNSDVALLMQLQNNPVTSLSSIRTYIRSKDISDILQENIGEKFFRSWIKAVQMTKLNIGTYHQEKIQKPKASTKTREDGVMSVGFAGFSKEV